MVSIQPFQHKGNAKKLSTTRKEIALSVIYNHSVKFQYVSCLFGGAYVNMFTVFNFMTLSNKYWITAYTVHAVECFNPNVSSTQLKRIYDWYKGINVGVDLSNFYSQLMSLSVIQYAFFYHWVHVKHLYYTPRVVRYGFERITFRLFYCRITRIFFPTKLTIKCLQTFALFVS